MPIEISLVLGLCVAILLVILGSLLVWCVVMGMSSHAAKKSMVDELRELAKRFDQMLLKFEGSEQLDELQQKEMRQMLKIMETRLHNAIERSNVDAKMTENHRTEIHGGQNVLGKNDGGME